MSVLETERLVVRRFHEGDAPFILELLNEPGWLRYIGSKNVHSLEDAKRYLIEGPIKSYATHGFGLFCVDLKKGPSVGMCGFIRRDDLEEVDIGFAFLENHARKGYAKESASALLDPGRRMFGLSEIVAITLPENIASIRLIEKLGMHFKRTVTLPRDGKPLRLYSKELDD